MRPEPALTPEAHTDVLKAVDYYNTQSPAAAYVPDLGPALTCWKQHLNLQGWVALIEIDDLFGHAPVAPGTSSLLAAYAQDALAANRYDFHMGRKLRSHLEQAGFTVVDSRIVVDE